MRLPDVNVLGRVIGVILGVLLAAPAVEAGRETGLQTGLAAPAVILERVLQGPDGGISAWDDLRGQAVVLEFWATWCGPCLRLLPHMNRLVETYRDRPIRFISVTDEDEATVTRFLAHREVKGWIGLDPDGALFEAYRVWSIPYAALVDASGVLRAVLHPADISEQILDDLISGHLRLEPRTALRARPATTVILPSRDVEPVRREGRDGGLELRGYPLEEVIAFAHGLDAKRIDMRSAPSAQRFDVLMPPGQGPAAYLLLRRTMEAMLGFRTVLSQAERDVYVLRRRPGQAVAFPPLDPGEQVPAVWVDGILEADSLESLARLLESELDRPVVNETASEGAFLIRLRADPTTIGEVLLRHGVELVAARRVIECLRVEGL